MKPHALIRAVALFSFLPLSACIDAGSFFDQNVTRINPVDGMSFAALAKTGTTKGVARPIDFIDIGDPYGPNGTVSRTNAHGTIEFRDGELLEGQPDTHQMIRVVDGADGILTGTRVVRFNSYYDQPGAVKYTTETIGANNELNGATVLRGAQVMINPDGTEEVANFVYLPADANGKIYVGAMGTAIFGSRTTATQVAAQTGVATYRGVAEGISDVLTSQMFSMQRSKVRGTAVATINFDAASGPSFSTIGTLSDGTPGSASTSYSLNGTINPDGSMNTTGASLDGTTANYVVVKGGLFGPDAENLAHTFRVQTGTTTSRDYKQISGIAIMSK